MAATPDHYGCALPLANFTVNDLDALSPPERRNGILAPSRCRMYDVNFTTIRTKEELLARINASLSSSAVPLKTTECRDGWVYSTAVYGNTVVTEWDLVCDHEVLASLSFACSTIGGLFGAFIWAFLADRFGRKPAFFSMLGFQLVGCIVSFWFLSRNCARNKFSDRQKTEMISQGGVRAFLRSIDRLIDWFIGQLFFGSLMFRLIAWFCGLAGSIGLIHCSIDWLIDWLTVWLIKCSIDLSMDWWIDGLIDWSAVNSNFFPFPS